MLRYTNIHTIDILNSSYLFNKILQNTTADEIFLAACIYLSLQIYIFTLKAVKQILKSEKDGAVNSTTIYTGGGF